jgi:cysteine synthase A
MIDWRLSAGVAGLIGQTPLCELRRLFAGAPYRVFGKMEWMNPGGSSKDRSALGMLQGAIARGDVQANSTVIESSSGNLAIALAQLCAYLDLRFICVVDPRTTPQHIAIIRAYGGEVEVVRERDPDTGEYLPVRIARVQALLRTIPGAYWTNQYANPDNARIHQETTAAEIITQLAAQQLTPDYLFVGVSSCGTLRGVRDYINATSAATQLIAVDAAGSVLFGGGAATRRFPGLGAAVEPGLYAAGLADHVVKVSDAECVAGCRALVRREAVLAGASSGGVLAAVSKFAPRLRPDAVCVVILPDRGERYLDTVYSDTWIRAEGVDDSVVFK